MEKKIGAVFDPNSCGCEDGSAAMVTEESNGDQGARRELRKNMGFTGCVRQTRNMQSGSVAGLHVATIRKKDRNAGVCWLLVAVRGSAGDEMSGAAGIGNDEGRRWS